MVLSLFRYDKKYGDPYFNTREQSFMQHLLYLMTRWINPVHVHWISPVKKHPDETAVQFSERVKALISETAGLKNLSWDGYLKNYRPTSEKQDKMRLETRQEYLNELSKKLRDSEAARRIDYNDGDGDDDVDSDDEDEDDHFSSPKLPEKDYFPEWLNEDERTSIQNELLRGTCPHPHAHNNFDRRLRRSRENLGNKIKELREAFSPKQSSSI